MKHFWLITLFGIGLISFTGCYTQLTIRNDNEVEEQPAEPRPIPGPEIPPPCLSCYDPDPPPIYIPPEQPTKERVYKYRTPQTDRPNGSSDRDRIRNTGGRNNSGGRGGRR